jgi:hypothetical protein
MNQAKVIEGLRELSDIGSQRKWWLAPEGEVSSFTEAISKLFDDSGLGDVLDRGKPAFTPSVDMLLRRLSDEVGGIDQFGVREELIADPKMQSIRELAARILSLIDAKH